MGRLGRLGVRREINRKVLSLNQNDVLFVLTVVLYYIVFILLFFLNSLLEVIQKKQTKPTLSSAPPAQAAFSVGIYKCFCFLFKLMPQP